MSEIVAIIPAAGRGSRMRSQKSKIEHTVAGRPLWRWVVEACARAGAQRIVTVVSPDFKLPNDALPMCSQAVQTLPAGTGDAVRCGMDQLPHVKGTVLIAYGDTPLLTEHTLRALLDAQRGADLVLTVFTRADPAAYGRVLLNDDGTVRRIVEARDCSPAEAAVTVCNAGPMAVSAELLRVLLPMLTPRNAAGEYYLTDIVDLAVRVGKRCTTVAIAEHEAAGVNDRADLAQAERFMQQRLRAAVMAGGVTLVDPDTVYLRHDTQIEADVTIEPNVVFGADVQVATGAHIKAFSHLEGVRVGAGVQVGPFARLRAGTVIEAGAYVGNFAEVKNTRVGAGSKIGHFSYTGDAVLGENVNIGAGAVTCNFDGVRKHASDIGSGAFIGSGSMLVAPVRVGSNAIVGAGTVVQGIVPNGALALTRAPMVVKLDGRAPAKPE